MHDITITHTVEEALAAIERLDKQRTGIPSFDYWIEYAIRDWNNYILAVKNNCKKIYKRC